MTTEVILRPFSALKTYASIGADTDLVAASPTGARPCRAIWVGGTGNLAVTLSTGTTDTIKDIPAGTMLNLEATQIVHTGTTVTDITVFY